MIKRLVTLSALLAFGLSLSGCTKCGWLWEDWRSGQVCKGDFQPR